MPGLGFEQLLTSLAETRAFPQPPLLQSKYPIVLLHGFGALASLMKPGMLHRQAMHLRANGLRAYAPHVHPYDTTAVRGNAWAERLEVILRETGAEKVNLIGFSSGGLDARFVGGLPEWQDRVASIITVSTPNHGSPLATYFLEKEGGHRALALFTMETVGKAAYPSPPNVATALSQMTPEYVCDTFNPAHPLPEGMYCASFAAAAGRGTSTPMLSAMTFLNAICYELAGVNDGYVPVESAWWGERLALIEADHAQIIGATVLPSKFDTDRFFLSIARHIIGRGY